MHSALWGLGAEVSGTPRSRGPSRRPHERRTGGALRLRTRLFRRSRARKGSCLADQGRDYVAVDVGETTIDPIVPEGEPRVIDPELVQDRRVDVVH
jgi:hypothetical protein